MFNRSSVLVIVTAIVLVLIVCITVASLAYSTGEEVLPTHITPVEVVEIIGPYTKLEIVKGFNTTRSNHVSFKSKEALIILKVKQVSNNTETSLIFNMHIL